MKVSAQMTVRQTLRGSLGERELLAFLRQSLEIPEGANVFFHVLAPGGVDLVIDDEDQLLFTVSWEDKKEPTEARLVPTRAVTPVVVPESRVPLE